VAVISCVSAGLLGTFEIKTLVVHNTADRQSVCHITSKTKPTFEFSLISLQQCFRKRCLRQIYIWNVHLSGLCETQDLVVCWSLILQSKIIIIIIFPTTFPLSHSCSLSNFTLHLSLCLVFLHAVTDRYLRHVSQQPLYMSSPGSSLSLNITKLQYIFNCRQKNFISAVSVFVCVCVSVCVFLLVIH